MIFLGAQRLKFGMVYIYFIYTIRKSFRLAAKQISDENPVVNSGVSIKNSLQIAQTEMRIENMANGNVSIPQKLTYRKKVCALT